MNHQYTVITTSSVVLLSEAQSVLVTFAITVVIVLALTIFACQTKYDFTGWKTAMSLKSLKILEEW